jgi:hypothetical protein
MRKSGIYRVLGAVVMLAAVTCLASACSSSNAHPGVVTPPSSTDNPTARSSVAPASPSSKRAASATAAACTATSISAAVGEKGPANGTENVIVLLRNTGARACWLGGLLTLDGVTTNGNPATHLQFHASADPADANPGPVTGPGLVQPNAYGALLVSFCINQPPGKCPAPVEAYAKLRIELGTSAVDIPYPDVFRIGAFGNEGPVGPVSGATGLLGR